MNKLKLVLDENLPTNSSRSLDTFKDGEWLWNAKFGLCIKLTYDDTLVLLSVTSGDTWTITNSFLELKENQSYAATVEINYNIPLEAK